MTAIIDYGAGNLHSVKNALDFLGERNVITSNEDVIRSADRVILPGVGAFGDAMSCLRNAGLENAVIDAARSGKPFLGICLGLHLLFEKSEETPDVRGLGIFRGSVKRIPFAEGLKIPHMGWNSLELAGDSRILSGIGEAPFVYFVHSYYICPEDEAVVSAYTSYGERLAVAVESGNIFATQFHPEKSGDIGMTILKNFIALH